MASLPPFFAVPIIAIVAGCVMIIGVVGITFWFKARERELTAHQELRTREMEHQRKMKELELEIERTKARRTEEKVV